MNENIKRLLHKLRTEYLLFIILPIFIMVVMTILSPSLSFYGLLSEISNTYYMLNVVGILLALALIPLAYKLFSLNTSHNLRWMNKDEALSTYHRWSVVRESLLSLSALINFAVNYLTLSNSSLICCIISLVAFIGCFPRVKALLIYLNELNEKE